MTTGSTISPLPNTTSGKAVARKPDASTLRKTTPTTDRYGRSKNTATGHYWVGYVKLRAGVPFSAINQWHARASLDNALRRLTGSRWVGYVKLRAGVPFSAINQWHAGASLEDALRRLTGIFRR